MSNDGNSAARPRRRTLGLAVITGIVACIVAAALGLMHATDGYGSGTADPKSASTAPTARDSGDGAAVAATPSVCGNVKGQTVMPDGMVMAPVPHRVPGPADLLAAQELVTSVTAGIAKYSQLPAAIADGYVPATNPNGYVVRYANWAVVRAGDVLDSNRPSSLVYANTVSGPLLLGAMFLGPAPCVPGPDVAGPLTQWHAHTNLCLSGSLQVVGRSSVDGQCSVGHHNTQTYFMMHVWTASSLARNFQFDAHVPNAAFASIIRTGRQ
jgi:hypothetical protein